MVKREGSDRKKKSSKEKKLAETPPSEEVDDVKKVMELTHCTEQDAQLALADHNNEVNVAVLAVLENADAWKENKTRKLKKQDTDKEESKVVRRQDAPKVGTRGRNLPAENRPGNARFIRQPQGPSPRQGRGYRPENSVHPKKALVAEQKLTQELIAEVIDKEDENNWKGPRVFEQSVPSTEIPIVADPPKNEKPTFAEIAAKKKNLHPVSLPVVTEFVHIQEEGIFQKIESPIRSPAPVMMSDSNEMNVESELLGPAAATNLTVNKEQTQDLKNEIGLTTIDESVFNERSFATVAVQAGDRITGSYEKEVTFMHGDYMQPLGYEFGFHSGNTISVNSIDRPKQNALSFVNYSSVNIPPSDMYGAQKIGSMTPQDIHSTANGQQIPLQQQFVPLQQPNLYAQSYGYPIPVAAMNSEYAQNPGNRMNAMLPLTSTQSNSGGQQLSRTDNRIQNANASTSLQNPAYVAYRPMVESASSNSIGPPPGISGIPAQNPYMTHQTMQSLFNPHMQFPTENFVHGGNNNGRQVHHRQSEDIRQHQMNANFANTGIRPMSNQYQQGFGSGGVNQQMPHGSFAIDGNNMATRFSQ